MAVSKSTSENYYKNIIVLRLFEPYPPFFQFVRKHFNAYLELGKKLYKGEFYLELLSDGILFIFANEKIFREVHKPISRLLKFFSKFKELPEEERLIFREFYEIARIYPEKGLNFNLILDLPKFDNNEDIKKMNIKEKDLKSFLKVRIIPILEPYYHSVHSDIEIKIIDPRDESINIERDKVKLTNPFQPIDYSKQINKPYINIHYSSANAFKRHVDLTYLAISHLDKL